MNIQWKNLFYAGVAGYSAGKVFSWLKKHPTVWHPVSKGMICAGVSGSVLGMGIAWYRNRPLVTHSLSIGASFAVATGSFIGLCYFITEQTSDIPADNYFKRNELMDYVISGGSGLTVGSTLALLSRCKIMSIFLFGFGGLFAGLVGQFSYDQFELWRKHKAIELNYPHLVDSNESDRLPWSFERFEKVWLNFWHRQSRAGVIESDIAVLLDCIEEEKRKIEAIDSELSGYVSPDSENNIIELHKSNTTTITSGTSTEHCTKGILITKD